MSHTWDHLLLAKFYNQRVSGQGSVNNASIYQAALGGESIQSAHLVPLPPSWSNTHLGCWAGQPLSAAAEHAPQGRKEQEAPKGWHFSETAPPFTSHGPKGTGGKAERENRQRGASVPPPPPHPLPRARRPQNLELLPKRLPRVQAKPKLTCFLRAPPPPGSRPGPQTPHRVVYVKCVSKSSGLRTRFGGLHL